MQELASRVSKFDQARLLCIGDLMFDQFIFGQVSRISPEAPIPVLQILSEQNSLGGAGNVARNLSSLGATCYFIGLVGEDEQGQKLINLAKSLPKLQFHIIQDKNYTTITKTRYIAGNQQLLRVDNEVVQDLHSDTETRIIALINEIMPLVDGVILSDYGKGLLSDAVIRAVIEVAHDHDKTVMVDPKGSDFAKYRHADLITPNQKELEKATGIVLNNDQAIIAAAHKLIDTIDINNILVTRGAQGMSLIAQNGGSMTELHIPTTAQEVFDVSGAGDTVMATLATACAVGGSLEEAATLANLAAGIVVGKVGTAVIRAEELQHALEGQVHSQLESKIVSIEKAVELREVWRRKNLRVGFTNGCFDLLHSGHVTLLRQARAQCDRLVLGLNTDSSVKRLKGESRPIQNEVARALVLSSLADVDLVVLFEEDTPLELIAQLCPDLLVKGSDYTVDKVVGADIVQKQGGRVLLIDLVPDQSTSGMVKRIELA